MMKVAQSKGTANLRFNSYHILRLTILALACSVFCECGGGGGTGGEAVPATSSTPPPIGCVGTPLAEASSDVTTQLSQLAGVTVTQITNNGTNSNTYPDVPAFSSPTGLLTYNHSFPSRIVTASLDGTGTQIITDQQAGQQAFVTIDGKYIYYQGENPDKTSDIYAVEIGQSGSCQQLRLSNLSMTPIPPLGAIQISPSSIDPATNFNVIAFSEGLILHRVEGSGMSWYSLPDVNLPDPENTQVFHRIRLNPVFPNIIWWKRDAPNPNPGGVATPPIYVANLNASPIVAYSVAGAGVAAGHPAWSPNGLQLGYVANGVWTVANILNSDGTFALQNGTFATSPIGPQGTGFGADYCTWSPDGTVFLCNSLGAPGAPIYLMSLDGSQTKILADTNTLENSNMGIPKPGWLDMNHIIFASDWSGSPQVYVVSGFTTSFP